MAATEVACRSGSELVHVNELEISTSPIAANGDQVIRVTGELDCLSGPDFAPSVFRLVAARSRRVVLDVSAVSFCGAAGLAALGHLEERLIPRQLTIRSPQPIVARVVTLTGFDRLLA